MDYIKDLKEYLDSSPVNFFAAQSAIERLEKAGFSLLDPADRWELKPGDRRYIIKNSSAVFAFEVGDDPAAGFKIISAHSDSPCFRIKPNAEMRTEGGVLKLNVEVYGGPILYTWFDRPLSIAGRVMVRTSDPLNPRTVLVRFDRPLLTIPHLAIHFNRQVNEGNRISPQADMIPIIAILAEQANHKNFVLNLVAERIGVPADEIIDVDLSLYDTTPACTLGASDEFFTSGRLDDLGMVHAGLTALIESVDNKDPRGMTRVMAIFDNEETGSGTKQGAASPVLMHLLRRVVGCLGGAEEDYLRGVSRSFMVSADNAHAFHPNYASKYDPTNHPIPGRGPVIKINARCKYMTDADSAAVFAELCRRADVPVQYFVNHSDVAGGSTLGNILTSQIDLRGVDMGVGIWAMHSVRETMATADHAYTIQAFSEFYSA